MPSTTLPRFARPLVLALLAVFLASHASAQGGYRKEEHDELGLTFKRPALYEPVPLQPDEEWKVLFYSMKDRKGRTKDQERDYAKWGNPEVYFVVVPYRPDPEPAEGEVAPGSGKRTSSGDKKDAPRKPITTIERYLKQRMGYEPKDLEEGKQEGEYASRFGELKRSGKTRGTSAAGFVYSFRNEKRTVALIGFCHPEEFEDQAKIWKTMAESLDIEPPVEADMARWERYYERKKYRDPEYRIRVRGEMVKGWEAEDLENYIVVHHTKDQPLLRGICKNIEGIRKKYVELFPPAQEVTAVSTVRVCRDREEYLRYGGMDGSAGYWNWVTEELVLYDAVQQEKGKRPKDDDTFIVLYHEAFHQYIYYSAGQLSPHSWYNEGFGDYFSGALVKGGKARKIELNPWRAGYIQALVERGEYTPWENMIRWSQQQYYANAGPSYAQGWSMIYFLNESSAVANHERWSRILPIYFDTIKRENQKGLEELGAKANDRRAAMRVGLKAREVAVDEAFDGVDLDALQEAWVEFVLDLDVPERD